MQNLCGVDGSTVRGCQLSKTTDGGFLISGYTKSYAKQPENSYFITTSGVIVYTLCHENADMWVFKTDVSGTLPCKYAHPTDGEDYAFSVKQQSDGSVNIFGMTSYLRPEKVWSSTSSFSYGTEDLLIVKIK